ncbi:MAG: hypothetical protein R3E97_11140 [Candidatus Eisenbacteria bacterium]
MQEHSLSGLCRLASSVTASVEAIASRGLTASGDFLVSLGFAASLGSIVLISLVSTPLVAWADPDRSPAASAIGDTPRPSRENACVGTDPRVIFDCLEDIYERRDSSAIEAIYAEDFSLELPKKGTGWDRDSELTVTVSMFENETVTAIRLSFDVPSEGAPGPEPGTWVFENVATHLEVDVFKDGESKTYEVDKGPEQTFYVRSLLGGGFEIYRWVDFQSE